MLTDRYLNGIPADSRAAQGRFLTADMLTDQTMRHVRALNDMARRRGQTLAQMALAWAMRDRRVTSVLVGASSVAQLEQNVGALANTSFDDDELVEIDRHAVEGGVDIWPSLRSS
jgi:L-glyceraldehyde 3-phosphate reductase